MKHCSSSSSSTWLNNRQQKNQLCHKDGRSRTDRHTKCVYDKRRLGSIKCPILQTRLGWQQRLWHMWPLKNRHKEKNTEKNTVNNLSENHLIISWSVKWEDGKMSPFLIPVWEYSLSLGSEDKLAEMWKHKLPLECAMNRIFSHLDRLRDDESWSRHVCKRAQQGDGRTYPPAVQLR